MGARVLMVDSTVPATADIFETATRARERQP